MINPQIIKFATDTSNYGIKKNSNFIATSKNKICQASASLLSKSIKNKNKNSILSFLSGLVRNKEFKKLLKNKERINCVMLPLQTLQKAIDKAK
jgi:NifU-like protein involved in Fe-S cluster formation